MASIICIHSMLLVQSILKDLLCTLAIYKECTFMYIIDEAINGLQFLVLAQSESLINGSASHPMCSCSKARSCPLFLTEK